MSRKTHFSKGQFFISCLLDLMFAFIAVFGGIAVFSSLTKTNKKVDENTASIVELKNQLKMVEDEVAKMGYSITTSVDESGHSYVEINGLRNTDGETVSVVAFNSVDEFKNCYDKVDLCINNLPSYDGEFNFVYTDNISTRFLYCLLDDGIRIDGYVHTSEYKNSLRVPTYVHNVPVYSINSCAFYSCPFIEIQLPETLSFIYNHAFSNSLNLRTISFYRLNANVVSSNYLCLLNDSFRYCSALESINFPIMDRLRLSFWAFEDCSLSNLDLSSFSNIDFDNFCFTDSNLKTLKLPVAYKDVDKTDWDIPNDCVVTYAEATA